MTIDIEISDAPVMCSIDERQMKRVFFNLIGNAINHNPEGTAVKIGLSVIEGTSGKHFPGVQRFRNNTLKTLRLLINIIMVTG